MTKLHEIVISGISGRFPDCVGLDEFKKKLFSCSNFQRDDTSRWNPRTVEHDSPFITGKIPDWNRYDSTFFGVSSKLVQSCDPLLGICLETSFEAMVDAGINPYVLKGRNIGVVSTSSLSDAEALRFTENRYLDGQGMVGHARTMLANRVSYCFNFHGPSYNCDSSWTSCTQGLEIAAHMVATGAVEAAVVTSANIISFFTQDLEYKAMGMLAPGGRSLPFDNQAEGFSRSEGAVAIYIERAEDAKRSYCSIMKAGNHFKGDRSCCFVGIDTEVSDFFKKFYIDCKVPFESVSYIEAHGIGRQDIDAMELNALAETFSPSPDRPLLVGTVSGNVGNCESPKGLVSLAKVIIAMETGIIPPTVNYQTPNPRVPALADGRIMPVTHPTPLPGDLVGVNSFSLAGSASHVLVKRNPKVKDNQALDDLPRLIILQARNESGAQEILNKLSDIPKDEEFVSLVNDVFKVQIPAYLWRAYAITSTSDNKITTDIQVYNTTPRPVWFVFSGMGSQWPTMGRDLLRIPVFAAAVDRCDQVLRPNGIDIKHIITTYDNTIFDNILNCFVGIAAVQIGLVDILRTLGVTPDGMVGHSVGELACGYADGCLTAEQMILAAYARGKASLESDNISGMMAAVGLGYNDIKNRLPPSIDVACHNSHNSCTLSGPTSDVIAYVEQLKAQGVFAKAVSAGGIAYHSRHMEHVGPKLFQYLKKVIPEPKPRSGLWVSSSVPQSQWNTRDCQLCSAEYHTNNLLNPVLFEEACTHIPENAILIEIAPRGLLQAILRRSVHPTCMSISLTSNTVQSNVNHLLKAVGQLFLNNVSVDVNALYPAVTHPVSRGCPSLATLVTWDHDTVFYQEFSNKVKHLVNKDTTESTVDIGPENPDYQLWNHRWLNGEVVIPITHFLEFTWEFVFQTQRQQLEYSAIELEDCVFPNLVPLRAAGKELHISYTPVGLKFEIVIGELTPEKIAAGKLEKILNGSFRNVHVPKDLSSLEEVGGSEIYRVLSRFGLTIGTQLQVVKYVIIGNKECYSSIEWTGSVSVFLDGLLQLLTFLQVDERQELLIPTSIKKLTLNISLFKDLKPGSLVDVHYDFNCGLLVSEAAELMGVSFKPISPAKTRDIRWFETKLQPFTDKLSSVEFLICCVQLVSNAGLVSWRADPPPVHILVVKDPKDKHSIFTKHFSSIFKDQTHIEVNITEVTLDEAKEQVSGQTSHLYLLAGNYNMITAVEECAALSQNVYFLANMNENGKVKLNPKLRCTLENHLDEVKLALMKSEEFKNKAKVYEMKGCDWLGGLRQLMEGDDSSTPVILFSTAHPPRTVLPTLAKERYAHRIRTYFILDKDAPRFTLNCQLYRNQLALGLPVNILSGGRWCTLNIASVGLNHGKAFHMHSSDPILDVTCIGLNTTNFTLDLKEDESEQDMPHVDYCGLVDGQRVMGVGLVEPVTHSLTPDPILRWSLPQGWTMEEASTVPVIYTMAYYCMMLKAKLQVGETVLINGALSPIGQAVINVAQEMGATIIASVNNDEQASCLMKVFPKLISSHIIELDHQDLSSRVRKLTLGKGVKVVVNCLRGKVLQSSVNVMGHECRFLHLSQVKPEDCESIGMLVFLKRASFYGVSLDAISHCPHEWKETLRDTLQEGINSGTVRPFQKNVYPSNRHQEAIQKLSSTMGQRKSVIILKRYNDNVNNYIKRKEKPDLAVILSIKNTQLWMDTVELVNKEGHHRIVVLIEDEGVEEEEECDHFRRINQIIHRHRSDILMTSSSRLNSAKSARYLLNELIRLGNIATIITVNVDENNVRLVNLEAASRTLDPPVRLWVSFLGDGQGVSESRASAGLPVCCVRTLAPLQDPALLLRDLPSLLATDKPTSRFLLVSETVSTSQKKELVKKSGLGQLSSERIVQLEDLLTENPVFTEVVTHSPGHLQVYYDLLPLFVVPSLCGNDLRSFLRTLIHPAFLSSFPVSVSSVREHAEFLLQDLLRIQGKGKFNLLGDSWSSAVVLELGCQLEARGYEVQLFILEGGPSLAQDRLRALRERHNTDLVTSIMAELFKFTAEATKNISVMEGLEEKLGSGLVPVTVRGALRSVCSQLLAVQLFQCPTHLFRGHLTMISHQELLSKDVASLSQMCQQNPKIKITQDKSYKDLLFNSTTASIINENMFVDWSL